MIRLIVSVIALTFFIASCGPKTTSKVTMDPAQAKAKFGESFNSQELEKLAEADKIKSDADALAASAEEDFSAAKELMAKADKEEAKEKKQWYTQRADKAFNKGYEKKITASKKYAEANKISFDTHTAATKRFGSNAPDYVKIAAEEPEMNAESLMKESVDLRKAAQEEKDLKKKSQLLTQADELEFLAIDAQRTVLDIYSGKQEVQKPEIKEPIEEPIKPVKKEPEPVLNTKAEKIVYKIQIAASRVELAMNKLSEIYSPKQGEIINNNLEDGWYKYAIGEFSTYAEAQAYKDEAGVPDAFIIAYRENEKILLPEIEEKIKNGEMKDPRLNPVSQSDVIYMVQIAATKIPARPSQVKQMYHGKQIVSIRQSRGWYKYTVGNFDSRERAEQFREEAGVEGSFVVAFDRRGKEVILDR